MSRVAVRREFKPQHVAVGFQPRHLADAGLRRGVGGGDGRTLLRGMKVKKERDTKGGDRKSKSQAATLIVPPKLSDLGISKSQSS